HLARSDPVTLAEAQRDPWRPRIPLTFDENPKLAGGLLGSSLGSSVGLEMSLALLPVDMTSLVVGRELCLGSLEASAGSGFSRRSVDGDRCTSHETRDGSGEKHSLQHGLLRFVFGETRCADEAWCFKRLRQGCSTGRRETKPSNLPILRRSSGGFALIRVRSIGRGRENEKGPAGPAEPCRNMCDARLGGMLMGRLPMSAALLLERLALFHDREMGGLRSLPAAVAGERQSRAHRSRGGVKDQGGESS